MTGPADRSLNEGGFTLIETLIAVMLLGVGVIAVLGGLQSSIIGSRVNRDLATANTVLMSSAEAVKDEVRNHYAACPAAATSYNPVNGVVLPTGWTPSMVSYTVDCSSDSIKLQRITVKVLGPDGSPQSVEVLKAGP